MFCFLPMRYEFTHAALVFYFIRGARVQISL